MWSSIVRRSNPDGRQPCRRHSRPESGKAAHGSWGWRRSGRDNHGWLPAASSVRRYLAEIVEGRRKLLPTGKLKVDCVSDCLSRPSESVASSRTVRITSAHLGAISSSVTNWVLRFYEWHLLLLRYDTLNKSWSSTGKETNFSFTTFSVVSFTFPFCWFLLGVCRRPPISTPHHYSPPEDHYLWVKQHFILPDHDLDASEAYALVPRVSIADGKCWRWGRKDRKCPKQRVALCGDHFADYFPLNFSIANLSVKGRRGQTRSCANQTTQRLRL